jgi:tetratricopeptide (TPR) repeat protein
VKKYVFVILLVCFASSLFADAQKRVEDTEDKIQKMYLKVDNLSKQKNYLEALKICNKIENHFETRYKNEKDILSAVLLTRSYVVKSRVCCSMNDLTQAVSLMRKAVALYEKFPYLKQSEQYPKFKALLKEREIMLNNITYSKSIEQIHNLYDLGKYADAEKVASKLLKKVQEDKNADNKLLSLVYFLSGRNLVVQHKKAGLEPLEKSLNYFSKIKKGKEQFFDDYLTYDIYSFLSFAYKLNNQPENSLKYAKLLHKTSSEKYPDDPSRLIKSSITLAFAYRACNDKKNAVKYAKKTLELMKKDPTLKSRLHLVEGSIKEWSK